MPNDCWNYITITTKHPLVLNSLLQTEIREFHRAEIIKKGKNGLIIKLWSPWEPQFDWLSTLLDIYPGCWIKNEWSEEGGMAGVWIGFVDENHGKTIKRLEWRDLCLEEKYYLFLDDDKNESFE
jgi:hypothetical protein